jgi:branched-chain amino acid transport system substrate-binding protein
VQRELQAGTIVQIGNVYFWRQNVVYTGIDITKLNRIDQKSSSFSADFYLWFRYVGDAGLNNIEFPGGSNPLPQQPLFDPAKPIKSFQTNGVNYRLYQVQGEFKNNFDLRDYPFDRQKLTIRLQNLRTPSDRLIYATDTLGLQLSRTTTDEERYSSSLWQYKGIRYAKETVSTTSTKGDPRLFDGNNQVDYPGLSATITVQRHPLAVLGKTALPLLLLALVPLMTMFFSEKIVKERAAVTVTALIAGTVLLANAYRQLPEVPYTVRIEYLYYAFFGLSLFSIWIAIIGDHLNLNGHKVMAKRLDWVARVIYVATMLAVGYWLAFGDRV